MIYSVQVIETAAAWEAFGAHIKAKLRQDIAKRATKDRRTLLPMELFEGIPMRMDPETGRFYSSTVEDAEYYRIMMEVEAT